MELKFHSHKRRSAFRLMAQSLTKALGWGGWRAARACVSFFSPCHPFVAPLPLNSLYFLLLPPMYVSPLCSAEVAFAEKFSEFGVSLPLDICHSLLFPAARQKWKLVLIVSFHLPSCTFHWGEESNWAVHADLLQAPTSAAEYLALATDSSELFQWT